jgi:hypothetical protein
MADSNSTRGRAAGKSPSSPSTETLPKPIIRHGLVQHPLLSGSVQIRVLAQIDATGSARVGEIVALLAGHPDPVGAICVLLEVGFIEADLDGRPMDETTRLRRPQEPEAEGISPLTPPGDGDEPAALPLPAVGQRVSPLFEPAMLVLDWPERRQLGPLDFWRRPGVYLLVSGANIYVGASAELSVRVCQGSQPIRDVETIAMVGDARGQLDFEDALALERLMHMRLAACRDLTMVNATPDGAAIAPGRFDDLQILASQFALLLAREGVAFAGQSSRNVLAGPRFEKAFSTSLRVFDQMPDGSIHELEFNGGLQARAVHHGDGDWIVLRDSEIRIDTVSSANSSASYHRAALLHAGLLVPAPNGASYLLTRDIKFSSRSAAAHFVTGSKGHGRGGWKPIDPHGGHDPMTDMLIAS